MAGSPASSVRGGFPLGLTGATAATRYVGATASGAPASGTFAVGDFCIDQSGKVFVCTAAGTPGTWAEIGGSGGGFTKVADQLLGSAGTFDFTAIAQTYLHLEIWVQARATNAAATAVLMTFNNDSAANYDYQLVTGSAAVASATDSIGATGIRIGAASGSGDTAARTAICVVRIPNYAATTFSKECRSEGGRVSADSTTNVVNEMSFGSWRDTSAISRVTIAPQAGATFVTGSRATLYGLG